jgi:hypothetical protein
MGRFMWSGRWDKAAERAFLRGADGIVALQARAQDSGEAGREVATRLLACCFTLVTHEDVDTELEEAAKLLAKRGSGGITDDPSGRAWLTRVLGDRATGHNEQHQLDPRYDAGYVDAASHPAWTLLALPGLAWRLRLLQAATKTTAVALGRGLGTGAHHVARWAAGSSLPSPARREQLAAVLGVHAAWLAEERDDTPEVELYRYPACPCGSDAPFTSAALAADPGSYYGPALDENGPVMWCDGCGQPYLRDSAGRLLPLPIADPPIAVDRPCLAVRADNGGLGLPWPHSLWSPGSTHTRGDLRVPPLLTAPPQTAALPRRPAPAPAAKQPRKARRAAAQPGVWPEPGSARTTQAKVRALALWVGGAGRPLTSTGQIRLADARRLIDILGTGDAWVEVIGDASFPTRSSASLSGLQRLLVWAKAAGLLCTEDGRLEQTADAARLTADPQALREAMFDALPNAAAALHGWAWVPSPLTEPEILDTVLGVVWETLRGADGAVPVSELADEIWEVVSDQWQFERQDKAEQLLRRDVPILLEACQAAGAVRLNGKKKDTVVLTAYGRARTAEDATPSPSPAPASAASPAKTGAAKVGADGLDELDWVVWRLEVKDPQQLAEDGLDERTQQAMTELAGSLGCQYDHCVDHDSMDGTPEGTYYAWWVRVPRAEHQRRGPDGLPRAVTALHEHLRTVLPAALTDWSIAPDGDLTTRVLADTVFKETYADLIEPLELALLGLRRDGAENLDPWVTVWAQDGQMTGATYALWLCDNPDVQPGWLVVYAGYLAGDRLWQTPLGQNVRRFGVRPDTPVLTFPRPEHPMWVVQAETARIVPDARPVDHTGARHQWTGHDGQALADRVASDLLRLWPHLA